MPREVFVGTKELLKAQQMVGSIVNACSRLEEAISYLEWQLKAFSWATQHPSASSNELQIALDAERKTWDKYASLETRLSGVTKAFEAEPVSARMHQVPRLREMRRSWESLREKARSLGKLRNEIGHSFLAYTDGKVIRQVGRPWNEQKDVIEENEAKLASDLGALTQEVGVYSTELDGLLPFVDMNRMTTTVAR